MEFGLLGPLTVVHDGDTIGVPGGNERRLLAQLLVQANRVVATDTLIDQLWPEGHPNAEASLWTLISRLRRLLDQPAGGRRRLVTRKPGYLVEVDADHFDVTAFEAAASRARAELTAGRVEQATATLSWALALWRGPALAEFATPPSPGLRRPG